MRWPDWGWSERRWKTAPNEQVRPSKTLWDVAQLLIVPVILVGVTFAWSYTQTRSDNRREDRRIAADRAAADQARQDTALESYLVQMSELMLDRKLLTSKAGAVRGVARTVTLATLRRLNGERKGQVVRFLREAGLIQRKPNPRVVLFEADLAGADLKHASLTDTFFAGAILARSDLRGADFRGADLTGVNLRGANLRGADFEAATLARARLVEADLTGAGFRHANFRGADLSGANLSGTSLRGANLVTTGLTQKQLDEAITDEDTKLPKYLSADQSD